jgi:steroid delta-isomerase-like uncharacterized protein
MRIEPNSPQQYLERNYTMAAEANKAIARREIEEFESNGNLAVADEVLAPNYRLHFPGFPPLDREGHKQVIAAFRSAFPDMRIAVELQLAEGDRVANHITMLGTHQGEFQGVPATGKAVAITGTNIMRFEGDQIAELWGYLDAVGMLQQLGVIPPQA